MGEWERGRTERGKDGGDKDMGRDRERSAEVGPISSSLPGEQMSVTGAGPVGGKRLGHGGQANFLKILGTGGELGFH